MVESVTEMMNFISSVGFPIAMCLIIMYYWNNQYNKTIEELKNTISQLTTTVAENNKALALVESALRKGENDNGE